MNGAIGPNENMTGDLSTARILGRGATATVYEVSPTVAVKIFHPELMVQPEFSRRVDAEVKASQKLVHSNIVVVHGLQKFNGISLMGATSEPLLGLVMELVPGETLHAFQSRLPYILPELSVLILIEILKALECAHEAGVIHRDLKPSNILVTPDGAVKVTDFGLAKVSDFSTGTVTGGVVGSPDFMSPEQARGDVVTERSDVFSAGSILYFLTTGTRPFSRGSTLATLGCVVGAECESVQARNPKVSPALARLIRHAMHKRVADRPGSAREFRGALEGYLAEIGLDEDFFTLERWLKNPSVLVREALEQVARTLVLLIDSRITNHDIGGATELLSHLSIVAPESDHIAEILLKLEGVTSKPVRRPSTRSRWSFAVAFVLGAAVLFSFFYQTNHLPTPTLAPTPVTVSAIAKALPPAALPIILASAKPTRGPVVRFEVPKNVQVFWDRKPVPLQSGRGTRFTTVGQHELRLVKQGFPPMVQTVEVSAKEPTNIKVHD